MLTDTNIKAIILTDTKIKAIKPGPRRLSDIGGAQGRRRRSKNR
jgi:hypothetical protein